MRVLRVLTLLASLFLALRADFECPVTMARSLETSYAQFDQMVSESFILNSFTLRCNAQFSAQEFLHLAGAKIGQLITPEQLKRAITYLACKDQFKSVTFKGVMIDAQRCDLTVTLEADWILADVSFTGISMGQTQYLQYYEMQPGERFDQKKHEASLEKIAQVFHQRGYKDAHFHADIKRNEKTHRIYVRIGGKKGYRFSIANVVVDIRSVDARPLTSQFKQELARKFIRPLRSKRYNQELITKRTAIVQRFLIDQGFTNSLIKLSERVDPETREVSLRFTVKLGKRREFVMFGNRFFSDKKLLSMITQFGSSLTILPPSLLAQDMIAEYHKRGFWKVEIEGYEQDDNTTHFVINEGPRAKIKEVELKGVTHFRPKKLVDCFLRRLTNAHFFNGENIKRGTEKLLAFYRQQGLWDAKILRRHYEPLNDKEWYRCSLTIDEGMQRFLKKVTIKGFPELNEQGPFARLNSLKKPIPFDRALLAEQLTWLTRYFKRRGYFFVKAEPIFDPQEPIIDVVWDVHIGEKVRYGKIIVKGVSDVSYRTIKSLAGLREGHFWNKDELQLAHLRLKELDVFKQIRLYPLQTAATDRRDVVVNLQNDDPFELRVRMGFQQISKNFALKKGSTYKVGSSFLWRNPTGNADCFRIDADVTRFERSTDMAYTIPASLRFPLINTFKVYSNRYVQPFTFGSRRTLYNVIQDGFLNSFTTQTSHTNFGFTCGLEWMETKDISVDLAKAINFEPELIGKKIPYLFVEPSLFLDLLDDKVNSTKGLFVAASLKGMFPFKASSYLVKFLVENGVFFPLFKNHNIVCAFRGRFGHILKESFNKVMPPERFYLGGANSLRGYLPDACPPLGTYIDDDGTVSRVPQGGKSMVNTNFELRIPLTHQFDCVFFQDFGVLVENLSDVGTGKNNLAATGFGIRYQTSIGPVRFDIGWKWQKPFPEDTPYAWFLTFGQAF